MAFNSFGAKYSEINKRSGRSDESAKRNFIDRSVHVVYHLATFTVSNENHVLYPADGMRKLLQLEKSSEIYSHKMQMSLEQQFLSIIDYETGNLMEKIHSGNILEPTAFTSQDPKENYNNILVFIIDSQRPDVRPDMHIFQCEDISSVHLVEDIKNLRNSKGISEADTSSFPSQKYERDVEVLNYCFDDIEKFVARLDQVAAAHFVAQRRPSNKKSKKHSATNVQPTLETPPNDSDFIDIFAKFKLSFNLLAKLKDFIHDPNAQELVHFLFKPLERIIDASHDFCFDHLAPRVIRPLMTRNSVDLLMNSVSSREKDIWRSLGDPWIIPREQWNGTVEKYHPIFFSGWSPDYPVDEDLRNPTLYTQEPPPSPISRDYSTHSENLHERSERNNLPSPLLSPNQYSTNVEYLEELERNGVKIVEVIYPRTANNEKELTVERGEYLEILDDNRKWWKAKNIHGQVAHVPYTIVRPYNYVGSQYRRFSNPLFNTDYDDKYADNREQRNNFPDRPESISSDEDFLSMRTPLPSPVQKATLVPLKTGEDDPSRKSKKSEGDIQKPPPPPPMPPTVLPPTQRSRTNTLSSQKSNAPRADDMQAELKEVLTARRRKLDIHRTPEIFIQQSSNAAEVENWLKAKDFTGDIVKKLKGINGNELFALKKQTLEDICGVEEGRRLASQITIQRNVSGYKTARSSELQRILAKARQKTEEVPE